MNSINKIDGNFRGLTVHNQGNNVFEMNQEGSFIVNTKDIENISYNRITNISSKESIYKSTNSNLELSSENGRIILRNGKDTDTPKYEFNNPDINSTTDSFFSTSNSSLINEPFSSTDQVNNLRNDSFLIESIGSKSMCLYSNNGLNQVSHGNINLVSDDKITLQSNNNINLTSLGYLLFNSERMITCIEEDIIVLSSYGEIKLGGDGVNTNGIKINSNTDKNFVSIGKLDNTIDDKADSSLQLYINESSHINTKKNGLLIDSKNINNGNTYPDIVLNNYDKSSVLNNDTKLVSLNMGIGVENKDINNKFFISKLNDSNNVTFIHIVSHLTFNTDDKGKKISYVDTTYSDDTITEIINNKLAKISTLNTTTQNTSFGIQEAYIIRDNVGNLKTKTPSSLHLGTNNKDNLHILDSGNIGINIDKPVSNLHILGNNTSNLFNIRTNTTKTYYKGKGIQMDNGNYFIFYNTLKNSLYNLEYSVYNINNTLIKQDIIYENSLIVIEFDCLKKSNNNALIVYSYKTTINNTNSVYTASNVFNENGINQNINYLFQNKNLTDSSNPSVALSQTTNKEFEGYSISFRDNIDNNIDFYVKTFLNNTSTEVKTFNFIDLTNTYFTNNIADFDSISSRLFTYTKIIQIGNYNLIFISGKIVYKTTSTKTEYFTFTNKISLTFSNSVTTISLVSSNDYPHEVGKKNSDISDVSKHEILGVNSIEYSDNLYITYYLKDNDTNNMTACYIEKTEINEGIYNNSNLTKTTVTKISDLNFNPTYTGFNFNNIPSIEQFIDVDNSIYPIVSYRFKDSTKFLIKFYILGLDTSKYPSLTEPYSNSLINSNEPSLLLLKNLDSTFNSLILIFDNNASLTLQNDLSKVTSENVNDTFKDNTILFQHIDIFGSVLKITANNKSYDIKGDGRFISSNVVIPTYDSSLKRTNGEICFQGTNLYIYLNSQWYKMTLTSDSGPT